MIQLRACGPGVIVLCNKRPSGLTRWPICYLTGFVSVTRRPRSLRLSPFHPSLLIRLPLSRLSNLSFPCCTFSRRDLSILARRAAILTSRFLTSGCAGLCYRLTDEEQKRETAAASAFFSPCVCHTHKQSPVRRTFRGTIEAEIHMQTLLSGISIIHGLNWLYFLTHEYLAACILRKTQLHYSVVFSHYLTDLMLTVTFGSQNLR